MHFHERFTSIRQRFFVCEKYLNIQTKEAIEGHYESDSDSDNDEKNEEVDISDDIPSQNLDDMLLNAVAEEMMGKDNNSTENEDEELPVPGPSLRRNNGD
uniref:Uncharacterized protein n=1 Tax=Panagrolaimus davidi TaxID=227884 RepID=A0A914PGJ9_9BILA